MWGVPGPGIEAIFPVLVGGFFTTVVLFHCSVMSDSLQQHELQHKRFPCPSPSPRVCSNSCPLSWRCQPTISSSVTPFCSHPQSFPASGSSPMSRLLKLGDQSIGASAEPHFSSTLEMFFIMKSPSSAQSSTKRLSSTLDVVCVSRRIYNKWNHTVCYLWGLAAFTQFNAFEVRLHCWVYQHVAFCCWVVFSWTTSRSWFVCLLSCRLTCELSVFGCYK